MRTPVRRPTRRGALGILAAAVCGAATPAPAAAPAPPARVVTITAHDYFFEMPDTVAAGRTELRLANRGSRELHHAWLVRLDHGHTPAEFFAAVRRSGGAAPSWAQQVGGPNTPAPGGTSAAVVDLAPGNYLVLCGMPSPNGMTHLRQGMLKTFTVAPAATVRPVASRPAARSSVGAPTVTLTLTDAGFNLSKPITGGMHVVRVRNQGTAVHEVIIARLAPGVTAEQALNWLGTQQGPRPMTPLGGAVGLARGESNDVPVAFPPGEYALLCRQPDLRAERGGPAHRMMQQFTVK